MISGMNREETTLLRSHHPCIPSLPVYIVRARAGGEETRMQKTDFACAKSVYSVSFLLVIKRAKK
ncbi:MAG: hypothetical protein A2849_01830 [Candidatus Taylorbacteria bacterium RIFCSPHIGHO2_01_FULL_51_15]|uniref:Uncharacterized protein n=1 Tax=Candidatus Taylorbacteria bacterium RIFCSPHIGHO2_01_FULL_51_15 TaxID=1802304 RepID=A0A1G2MAW7_9BACT|nr:MAG: hypothetical protein A2849_01830 [Candidatus Taylorbacteria bacterium RIFCSPHIGHO2_01_FULL_51_15]